jgi:hypothetical protein
MVLMITGGLNNYDQTNNGEQQSISETTESISHQTVLAYSSKVPLGWMLVTFVIGSSSFSFEGMSFPGNNNCLHIQGPCGNAPMEHKVWISGLRNRQLPPSRTDSVHPVCRLSKTFRLSCSTSEPAPLVSQKGKKGSRTQKTKIVMNEID